MVLKQGAYLAGIGLLGAFCLTRLMGAMLFGVSATDPTTFVGVGALLPLVALGAVLVPAIRASRIEPARVLKQE